MNILNIFTSILTLFISFNSISAAFPKVVICSRGENEYPVHAVDGRKPVIRENGVDRTIGEPRVRIERNDSYQRGFINIIDQEGWGNYSRVNNMGVNTLPGSEKQRVFTSHIQLKFVSDTAFEDLYVAFVSYPKELIDKPCQVQDFQFISFDRIGEIEAGKEYNKKLRGAFSPLRWKGTVEFVSIPVFFSKGLEVQSNRSQITDKHFRAVEECWHQELLAAYLENNQASTMKHSPVVTYIPTLPESLLKEVQGERIIARIQIESDGTVKRAVLEQEVSAVIESAIVQGIQGWLFLPKLENGKPESSITRVPLVY